jgi:hypothetical protein
MKYITKLKLASIHQLCDNNDKSTEYMLQLMQDTCKVDLDTCVAYMDLGDAEHSKLFSELNSLVEVVVATENSFSPSNIEISEEEKEWMNASMGHKKKSFKQPKKD